MYFFQYLLNADSMTLFIFLFLLILILFQPGDVIICSYRLNDLLLQFQIFNTIFFYRMGLRGRELIQTVGKTMVQGGGTFGVFMSIGTGIRC